MGIGETIVLCVFFICLFLAFALFIMKTKGDPQQRRNPLDRKIERFTRYPEYRLAQKAPGHFVSIKTTTTYRDPEPPPAPTPLVTPPPVDPVDPSKLN